MASSSSKIPFVAGLLLCGASFAEAFGVVVQARGGPRAEDWEALRGALDAELRAEDGLVVGTRWLEPIARRELGDTRLTRERIGAPIETWPRVAIVSERGHASCPEAYVAEREEVFGGLSMTWARARKPFRVLGRAEANLDSASVFTEQGGQSAECARGAYGIVAGNLGSGPAWPSERFLCAGTSVARSFVTDTDYRAHDAIFADVPGDGRAVVVRFASQPLGTTIRGGVGLYVEAERDRLGAPVTLEWTLDGRVLGTLTHRDGEGWKRFELATGSSPGTTAILEMRLRSPGGARRLVGVGAAFVEPLP